MVKKVLHFDRNDAAKLHCDECGLDFGNDTEWLRNVPHPHVWGEHLIGMRCPECGADMLTRKDYEAQERAFRLFDWINKWFSWLFGSEPEKARYVSRAKITDGALSMTTTKKK